MTLVGSVQDSPRVVDDCTLYAPDLLRFPSPDLIHAAAGLFISDTRTRWVEVEADPSTYERLGDFTQARRLTGDQRPDAVGADYLRREGRDYLVGVGAGTVSVRSIDHERRQRTASAARGTVPGARLVIDADGHGVWVDSTPTRVVTGWSRKSRANMTRCLSELDYGPLLQQAAQHGAPAMVTLTYPGDWQAVASSGRVVKRHLRRLEKRFIRAWGYVPAYLWKLEFQSRGAPHFHLFIVPPSGTARCSCSRCECFCTVFYDEHTDECGRLPFHDRKPGAGWLAHQWADIVGAQGDELTRHRKAGVAVDYKEGARNTDPKRLAVYFTKHGGAAGGKEYQHRVPMEWRTAENSPGRFWGHPGLRRVRSEVYVSHETFIRVRRTMRRLARSRGLTRELMVPRGYEAHFINTSTGECVPLARRKRKVTRRRKVPCDSAAGGGFLLVNDGPATAELLSRL